MALTTSRGIARGLRTADPLVEYKKESFATLQALMDRIDEEILRWCSCIRRWRRRMNREHGTGPHGP